MATHFWHGIMVGFAICIPVGPIAALILRRTVADGRLSGFVSGLGAAMADALIGVIAVLFLAALMPAIEEHRGTIQLVGGAFIISMGVFILRTPPKIRETKRPLHERNLLVAFFSTCVLTLSNPITILSTTGIVAATGMGGPGTTMLHSAMLVLGVFTASTSWWVFLCAGAHWLARKLGNGFIRAINLIAAILIIGFGVYLIADQISDKTTGHRLRPKRRFHPRQISPPGERVRLPDTVTKPETRQKPDAPGWQLPMIFHKPVLFLRHMQHGAFLRAGDGQADADFHQVVAREGFFVSGENAFRGLHVQFGNSVGFRGVEPP